jgi:hypothetical protein
MEGKELFPMAVPAPTPADPPWLHPWIEGFAVSTHATPVGEVPRLDATLRPRDRWGAFLVRLGVGRMRFAVRPGLYALGAPGPEAPVLVTANYKLSLDHLRTELPGRDAWILVLDTRGVNVWCAAGKGTFGTAEIVRRVASTRLAEVVSHRRLILPQLGAPGVAAHEVKRLAGWSVVYGPVRAADLPRFLDDGLRAGPAMREKTFPLAERAVLIPLDLVIALKYFALVAPLLFFASGLGASDYWARVHTSGWLAVVAVFSAIVAGGVIVPLLLPWLPGRAFSVKGAVIGTIIAGGLVFGTVGVPDRLGARLEAGAWLVLVPALTAFLAMGFTGSSTYTSLSGVRREMRFAVPFEVGAATVGLALWIGARLFA